MLNKRTLPLSGLRAFESAGRHLHLGRAGEELGVTHGAISHQVRALEAQLGVKLFIRANSRLQLTDAGQRLLMAVGEGFEKILEGAQHLDPDSLAGSLIIACTQTRAPVGWLSIFAIFKRSILRLIFIPEVNHNSETFPERSTWRFAMASLKPAIGRLKSSLHLIFFLCKSSLSARQRCLITA